MIRQSRYELAPAATAILGTAWSVLATTTLAWIALAPTTRRRTEVVAAAIIGDGRLLLAQRSKPTDLAGKWELPGGRVEAGETAHEAVRREIREELGVDVEPLQRVGGEVPLRGGLVLRAYAARLTAGTPRALDIWICGGCRPTTCGPWTSTTWSRPTGKWLPTLIGMLAASASNRMGRDAGSRHRRLAHGRRAAFGRLNRPAHQPERTCRFRLWKGRGRLRRRLVLVLERGGVDVDVLLTGQLHQFVHDLVGHGPLDEAVALHALVAGEVERLADLDRHLRRAGRAAGRVELVGSDHRDRNDRHPGVQRDPREAGLALEQSTVG